MSVDTIARPTLAARLLPIMAAVAIIFLVTGATLPALPLHIHDRLGFGPFVVGLVAAAQFAASLISRLWAGSFSDSSGPKTAVLTGLGMAALAGLLYLGSLLAIGNPVLSVAVLLVGRALMGGAESFVITGAQSWGLNLAGREESGKVIGWIGTAMYVALAGGAPIGSLLFGSFGFVAIGAATLVIPALTAAMMLPMSGVLPATRNPEALGKVLKAVTLPGIGLAFASLAYGAMTAFAVLYFTERGWQPAWFSFTAFAIALIVARLAFGGLPDRMGGAKAALLFVVVQAIGMALIWASPFALLGFVGAFVAGFGYAFVYPGLGREAVRRAPAGSQGLAMGIYTAFLDVALGILTPLLGLLAGAAGLGSIFLVSAGLALGTVVVALRLQG
ncbi:arabinose transporter [Mesorhizobium sp. PL10]